MLLKGAITIDAERAEEPPPLVSRFSRYTHTRGFMKRAVLQIMAEHPSGIHHKKVYNELLASGYIPSSQHSVTQCLYNMLQSGDVERIGVGMFKVTESPIS